jgi:DNA polymerase-3 subunit delta'
VVSEIAAADPAELPPWLADTLARVLARQRGHALLLHGRAGDGVLALALGLARGWLCSGDAGRPCGRCGSCRLAAQRAHPDLFVVLPQSMREQFGWPGFEDRPTGAEGDVPRGKGRARPSRQIRIDEVRALLDWASRTPSGAGGKVAVIHPGEAMNPHAASALLKTLEEPPPGTRIVVTAGDPARLLPTVRSRCQRVVVPRAGVSEAAGWLAAQGIGHPDVLLAACAGAPLEAAALARGGVDAAAWSALPAAVAAGRAEVFAGWAVTDVVDALAKLCHDAMAQACEGSPAFFPRTGWPRVPADALTALAAWSRRLGVVQRQAEHPWHEALLVEALVAAGREALTGRRPVRPAALDTLPG